MTTLAPLADLAQQKWMDHALCAQLIRTDQAKVTWWELIGGDTRPDDPDKPATPKLTEANHKAIKICYRCPVRAECRTWMAESNGLIVAGQPQPRPRRRPANDGEPQRRIHRPRNTHCRQCGNPMPITPWARVLCSEACRNAERRSHRGQGRSMFLDDDEP